MAEAIVFDTMMRKASIISNRRDSIANSLIHDTHSMIDVQKNVKSESINLNNATEGSIYIVSVRSGSVNAGFVDNPEEELSGDCGLYHNGSGSKEQLDINGESDNISLVVIGALQEPRNGWPFTNQEIESIEQKIRSNSIQIKENDKTCQPLPDTSMVTSVSNMNTWRTLALKDYFIALSLFLITVITYGNGKSFSVLTVEWLKEFPQSKSLVLFVPNLTFALMSAVGLIDGFLINRFGFFPIIFFGCFLQTTFLLGSSFCPNALTLLIVLGFFVGCASCFSYLNCFILMGLYFGNAGKSFLALLSLAGPLSGIAFPNLIPVFINLYSWRGSMYISAAINFQMIPLALYLLLSQKKKKESKDLETTKTSPSSQSFFDPSLFKDPLYVVYVCAVDFTVCAANTTYGLLPTFLNKKGLDLKETAALYSIYCGLVAIPRLTVGLLQQWIKVRFLYIFIASSTIFGLMCILIPHFNSYSFLFISCIIMSLSMGGPLGLYTIGILECVGPEKYSVGATFTESSYGITSIILSYLAGLLVEITDSYTASFCLFGGTILASNALLFITILIQSHKTERNNR